MAFAQHTLGLTLSQLASIVGREAVERMQELPMQLLRQRSDEASARAREVARALRDEDKATPPMAGLASSRLEAALGEARAAVSRFFSVMSFVLAVCSSRAMSTAVLSSTGFACLCTPLACCVALLLFCIGRSVTSTYSFLLTVSSRSLSVIFSFTCSRHCG